MRYPLLYSLSTVNLIYHGNFNYKLNPVSTSFVADSGVGKSVVADLLQLIFVGPGEYESSTKGKGNRPFFTLVQGSSQGAGRGRGYAFVNVQTGPADYLIVGCLIEGTTEQCTPFVIQQGENFAAGRVRPMPQPLGWEVFVDAEGNVPTLKELGMHLPLAHEIVLRDFADKLPAYFQFLWDNNLTPLDLTKLKLRKDYAQIIRSFARSGELNQNPEYLEGFLFGEEAKDYIKEQHKKLLDSISRDQKTYADNKKRIEKIKDKIRRFTELDQLRACYYSLRQQQLAQAWYTAYQEYQASETAYQLTAATRQQLRQQVVRLHTAYYEQLAAENLVQVQQLRADRQRLQALPTLLAVATHRQIHTEATAQATRDIERLALDKLRKAMQVTKWLTQAGPGYEELRQHWQHQQTTVRNQELSDQLWQHLHQAQQAENLRALGWQEGCSVSDIYHDLDTWRQRAAEAHAVAAYIDLDNETSLAYWALHRPTPLTPEQESVLAHFGRLSPWRGREETNARFLEVADLLVTNDLQTETGKSDTGFWLCLAGTREWINWVPADQRLFDKPDKAQTKALLAKWQTTSINEAAARQHHYDTALAVFQAVKAFDRWEVALPLLPHRANKAASVWPESPLSLQELDTAINLHQQLGQLEQEAEQAKAAVEKAGAERTAAMTELVALQNEAIQLRKSPPDRADLAKKLWTSRRELRAAQDWQRTWELPTPAADQFMLPTGLQDLFITLTEQKSALSKQEENYEKLHATLPAQRDAEQSAQLAYRAVLPADQALPAGPHFIQDAPSAQTVEEARLSYRDKFRDAVTSYLSEDQIEVYLHGDYLVEFMREVLPREVHSAIGSTAEGQERLNRALHDINEMDREIAQRKFTELSFLVRDVRSAVDKFHEEILRLQSYFQREKTEITGGFRPFIRAQSVGKYPVEWLTEFQQKATDPAAIEQLAQAGTVDDILLYAFRQRAGTDEKATVAKILNPVHYIKLDFEMRNEEGHVNDGSNGQTFMAAALLNIARLAVIGRSGGASTATRRLRFMAVDEAHDLGSNYGTLLELATKEGFQFISLSIRPLTHHTGPHQRIYFLRLGRRKALRQNLPPLMLCRGESVLAANEPFAPLPPADLFSTSETPDAEA